MALTPNASMCYCCGPTSFGGIDTVLLFLHYPTPGFYKCLHNEGMPTCVMTSMYFILLKKVFSSRFSMNGSNLFLIVRVKLQSPAKAQCGHLETDHIL